MFTVTQAAKAAGISPSSVRGWGKTLAAVLSDSANPDPGIERRFTADDVIRLHTARVMRSDGKEWPEILAAIDAGNLILPADMPPQAGQAPAAKERTEEQQTALVTRLTATVARYEGELAATKDALQHARDQLAEERAARIDAERQAAQLAGKLDALQEMQPPPDRRKAPQDTIAPVSDATMPAAQENAADRDLGMPQAAPAATSGPDSDQELPDRDQVTPDPDQAPAPSWRQRLARWIGG